MPESITIPASIEDAVDALTGLGELIVARKWERSAIVAAFVRLGEGQGTSSTSGRGFESARDFAGRGIVGLSSTTSVTKYVQAWLDTHNDQYPRPGATRRLPNSEFPPMRTGTDGHSSDDGVRRTVERIVARPGGADALAEVIEEVTPVRQAVTRARLNRVVSEEQRREFRESNRARRERMEAASDEMFTRMEHSGLVDHEATLHIRTARLWLRKAAVEQERNPLMTDEQRADHDLALAECEHLLSLLRGEAGAWSDTDREFLRALGIEEQEVSS